MHVLISIKIPFLIAFYCHIFYKHLFEMMKYQIHLCTAKSVIIQFCIIRTSHMLLHVILVEENNIFINSKNV